MIMIICLESESLNCCLEKPPDGAWGHGNHWHLHGQYADSIGKLPTQWNAQLLLPVESLGYHGSAITMEPFVALERVPMEAYG